MGVTNPDNETSGMTEYERRLLILEEKRDLGRIKLTAYLLWGFLGWVMVHRMYLGQNFKGVVFWCLMAIAGFLFPVLWLACAVRWIVDLIRLPKMIQDSIRQDNNPEPIEGDS